MEGITLTLELLTQHASVRKYKPVELSTEEVQELVIAGQHAASSNFVQAYSAIHVTDQTKKEELAKLADNEQQFLTAGAVLVLCMDFYRIEKGANLAGQIDYQNAEDLLVAATDVSLFAQNIVVAAESKEYGICYIGGVRNNPTEISKLLGLPKGVAPMYALTIGVPDEQNEVKPRLPVEAILHENSYDSDKYQTLIPVYDETMNAYYKNRSSNQKNSDWSESMATFLGKPRRLHMKEFLQKQGFDFK